MFAIMTTVFIDSERMISKSLCNLNYWTDHCQTVSVNGSTVERMIDFLFSTKSTVYASFTTFKYLKEDIKIVKIIKSRMVAQTIC